MINPTPALARRLWTLAPAFHAAGIAYPDYLLELTWLLVGRIAPEQIYADAFPCAAWEKLWDMPEAERFQYYLQLLEDSKNLDDPHLAGIFQQAQSHLQHALQLTQLIELVCGITLEEYEDLAESYEQLLILASSDAQSQTYLAPPAALVDSLVIALQPQPGESIQDPVATSASFLIAAEQYTHLSDEEAVQTLAETQLFGKDCDLVRVRLALMNCLLHDIYHHEQLPILWEEKLGTQPLAPADVIVSNLLFCDGNQVADNKIILKALQTIYHNLTPQGRAAVIVPNSLLSASGSARQIRYTLLETCHLHTVLRLPDNLFYPYLVPAQVLFFHRTAVTENTQVWFYDMRHQADFTGFISAYGDDPYALQRPASEDPYWTSLSREQIAAQGDNLDYAWIEEPPEETAPLGEILEETLSALEDLRSLLYADFDLNPPDHKT